MIDNSKWINTISKVDKRDGEDFNVDPNIWINTIPPKKNNNIVNKFLVSGIVFVIGIILVTTVKNETRSLQREINGLEASIYYLKTDLKKEILEHEVITSPEYISNLAAKYLDEEMVSYKKSQIEILKDEEDKIFSKEKINIKKENKIKLKIAKKINKTKIELKKLQELSQSPKKIPTEVKTTLAQKIEEKKNELKNLYENPKEAINVKKLQKWGAFQVVKLFLGVPIIPGR